MNRPTALLLTLLCGPLSSMADSHYYGQVYHVYQARSGETVKLVNTHTCARWKAHRLQGHIQLPNAFWRFLGYQTRFTPEAISFRALVLETANRAHQSEEQTILMIDNACHADAAPSPFSLIQ